MDTSERPRPENTQELVAMWSAAKEEHFVQELVQLLPSLVGTTGRLDETQIGDVARHLVRAMHVAARPEGGIHAAMDYLTSMVESKTAAGLK